MTLVFGIMLGRRFGLKLHFRVNLTVSVRIMLRVRGGARIIIMVVSTFRVRFKLTLLLGFQLGLKFKFKILIEARINGTCKDWVIIRAGLSTWNEVRPGLGLRAFLDVQPILFPGTDNKSHDQLCYV